MRVLSRLLARTVLVGVAGVMAAWACVVLQAYWGGGALNAVASRIMAGEVLRPEALPEADAAATAILARPAPPPDLLRAAALFRVRQAEIEIAAGRSVGTGPSLAAADTAVRAALAVTPTDSFLWFALAWLGKARDGFAPAELPFLAASFRTGPREGWIALHRTALAVTVLPELPPPLRAATLAEFRDLVASNYIPAAATLLGGPGWSQRDALLAALTPLPDDSRAAFAQQLGWNGVDADVPGVARRRDRPWR